MSETDQATAAAAGAVRAVRAATLVATRMARKFAPAPSVVRAAAAVASAAAPARSKVQAAYDAAAPAAKILGSSPGPVARKFGTAPGPVARKFGTAPVSRVLGAARRIHRSVISGPLHELRRAFAHAGAWLEDRRRQRRLEERQHQRTLEGLAPDLLSRGWPDSAVFLDPHRMPTECGSTARTLTAAANAPGRLVAAL